MSEEGAYKTDYKRNKRSYRRNAKRGKEFYRLSYITEKKEGTYEEKERKKGHEGERQLNIAIDIALHDILTTSDGSLCLPSASLLDRRRKSCKISLVSRAVLSRSHDESISSIVCLID